MINLFRWPLGRIKGPVTLLDIGSDTLKVISLDKNFRILGLDFLPIPAGEPELANLPQSKDFLIVEGIRRLFLKHPDFSPNVYSVLSDRSVFIRIVRLFSMSKKEIDKAIRYEAKLQVPFSVDKAKIDYFILGEIEEKKAKKLEILLIVVAEEVINAHLELLKKANLNPRVIDLSCLAYWRLFNYNYPQFLHKTVALIDIGAGKSEINVFKKGDLCFSRFIPIGGQDFTRVLKEEMGLELTEAEKMKKEYASAERLFWDVAPEKKRLMEQVYEGLSALFNQFLNDLRRSFEFYLNQFPENPVEQIILTGGGSLIYGLEDFLSENLTHIPAEKFKLRIEFPFSSKFEPGPKEFLKATDKIVFFTPALALISWPQSKARVNLAPAKKGLLEKKLALDKFGFLEDPFLKWGFVSLLVLFWIIFAGIFGIFILENSITAKLKQRQNSALSLENQKAGFSQDIKKKMEIVEQAQTFEKMVGSRIAVNEIMEAVSLSSSSSILLEQVTLNYSSKQIEITGLALASEDANNFLVSLNKQQIFKNLELSYIKEITEDGLSFNKSFKIIGGLL